MGCNMFTEVGLPIMQGYPPPPRISLTQARKPGAYDLICRSIPTLERAVGEIRLVALLSL